VLDVWLPFIFLVGGMGVVMWFVARRQSASYRDYLERNVAETEKLVASQRATQAAVERQTAALERIATALEQPRGS
jgi:flagellar basal body-associated protein FliL